MLHGLVGLRIVLLTIGPEDALFAYQTNSNDSTLVELLEHLALRLSKDQMHSAFDSRACLLALTINEQLDLCLSWLFLR